MRSKFEERFAEDLKARGVSFDYEVLTLRYPKAVGRYIVDFAICTPRGHVFYVETKGLFSSADRTKMLAVKAAHPERDIRLVFQRSTNKLSKTSKTAYWQWAEKHGFRWAEQVVPDGWLQ